MKAALILFLCAGAAAVADPLINEPLPELHLVTGKVLHDAQVKGYLRRSVLVKHSEGAETIAYEEFPEAYREQLSQKRPTAETNVAPRLPRPTPPVSTKKRVEESTSATRPTLSLITSRIGSAFTTVELYNDADTPVEVRCSAFLAETSLGTILTGRQWVAAEVPDMVSNSLGSKQVIVEHHSAMLNVVFDPLPLGASITRVFLKTSTK